MFLLAALIHHLKTPSCIYYFNNASRTKNVLTLHEKKSYFYSYERVNKKSIFFKSDWVHFRCLHGPILGDVTDVLQCKAKFVSDF